MFPRTCDVTACRLTSFIRAIGTRLTWTSALVLVGCAGAQPPVEPLPPIAEETDPVVLAAGDIGDCQGEGPFLTADLLGRYPGTILAVGDLV